MKTQNLILISAVLCQLSDMCGLDSFPFHPRAQEKMDEKIKCLHHFLGIYVELRYYILYSGPEKVRGLGEMRPREGRAFTGRFAKSVKNNFDKKFIKIVQARKEWKKIA
jgi:hypothetical protein